MERKQAQWVDDHTNTASEEVWLPQGPQTGFFVCVGTDITQSAPLVMHFYHDFLLFLFS